MTVYKTIFNFFKNVLIALLIFLFIIKEVNSIILTEPATEILQKE
jgi:hypothetical protein